ncbi:MAG: hypothetical protein IJD93_03965 [Ruminococcus sp.]|nr:hypothetical protein [Ruminococcus sp.]
MDETKLLLSRLDDLIYLSTREGCASMGFLNERECAVAIGYLNNTGVKFSVDGGYRNANRIYICVHNDLTEPYFPIKALKVSSRGKRELTHRDYLGSLMGLGIKRECIGDIIRLNDKEAVVFVRDEIAEHIVRDLDRIGRESVDICGFDGNKDSLCSITENLKFIVTSMRVDNFVSSCINSSRAEAERLIAGDMVFVNYLQVKKPSQMIKQNDVISIRGYGKYIVGSTIGKTKRERLVINVMHYI